MGIANQVLESFKPTRSVRESNDLHRAIVELDEIGVGDEGMHALQVVDEVAKYFLGEFNNESDGTPFYKESIKALTEVSRSASSGYSKVKPHLNRTSESRKKVEGMPERKADRVAVDAAYDEILSDASYIHNLEYLLQKLASDMHENENDAEEKIVRNMLKLVKDLYKV